MSWQIGVSTGGCTDVPIGEMLPAVRASGVRAVEIGTPPRHFDPWQDDQVAALEAELRAHALLPVSIHAPFGGLLDLADPNPHHRHAAIGAILTAGSALRRLGGRLVIVHPSDLDRRACDAGPRLDDARASLRLLAENCARMSVALVVESPLPHLVGGQPDEFAWLLDGLDPGVGVCLDTGHTALGGHWSRFVEIAGRRLCHVHANDNRGVYDDHLAPGDGIIDWTSVAESLRAVRFNGWVMLELACPGPDADRYFARAYEQAARLLGASPCGT